MRLIITKHAHQRMDYHGITEDQIRVAIQRGAKSPQTEGLLARHSYIRVAYRMCGDACVVKTVMIER